MPAGATQSLVARHNHLDTHTHQFSKRDGTWTVQAGDTGNGIAVRLSITFEQLQMLNPGVNWYLLQIGQVLNIPCNDSSTGSTLYSVVAGDTGNAIAARYGITFSMLSQFNPGVDWNNLQIGQTLLVPTPDLAGGMDSTTTSLPTTTSTTMLTTSTSTLDGGMYLNTTITSQLPTTTADPANDSMPSPDPMQDEPSPFLTPPDRPKRSYDLDDEKSGEIVDIQVIRREVQTQVKSPVRANPSSASIPTYTVKAGDTGYAIAASYGISFDDISKQNPGVTWTNLQIGQVLALPVGAKLTTSLTSTTIKSATPSRAPGQDTYILYTGPASTPPYPAMSSWLNFSTLWKSNLPNIGSNCVFSSGTVPPNTRAESLALRREIAAVAAETKVSASYILAMVMQESAGCVRVPTTSSWEGISNPGLMQSFKGDATCNNGGKMMQPCPTKMIRAMLLEGVKGNQGVGISPALQQAGASMGLTAAPFGTSVNASASTSIQRQAKAKVQGTSGATTQSKADPAMAYYMAARIYNSGSMPLDGDLSAATGSTRCYVSDIVNRLMGWVNARRDCSF